MELCRLSLILLALFAIPFVISAQEVSIENLKQMTEKSADNLSTYSYLRTSESNLVYSNSSVHKEYDAFKTTQGKVDLMNRSGWWNSKLTDEETGDVLAWEGYFINGSEYWKQGQNWTRFAVNNTTQMLQDYNEIPGEVNLLKYSDMKIVGSENLQGIDSYKLVGSPMTSIYEGLIGLQLLAAYFPSPFPFPDVLRNRTLDISKTQLMNNSSIVVTAWVSKNDSILRRLDVNSSLAVTPKSLNIISPDFKILSHINESTVYSNFGTPLMIELPNDAQNLSNRAYGTDWRWALFGSVRP